MQWLLCVQLLSGMLFTHRKLRHLREKNLLDKNLAAKLEGGIIMVLFLITFVFHKAPIAQFLFILGVGASLQSCDFIFREWLRSRIQREFPDFIQRLILSMQLGLSFRSAVEKNLAAPATLWEKWLRTLFETRIFFASAPENHGEWWQIYVSELENVYSSPHHSLTLLQSLRHKLQIVSDFRRKSGQALLQARIQMVVMTGLYFALLLATMSQFSLDRHRQMVLSSLALFLAGQALFWWVARKTSWKV